MPTEPLKLVDEYKTVHDEIAMCQKEMHQTWLWATIAAGAIYTWLASHGSEINNLGVLRWLIWLVPPALLSFCALRYTIFNQRISWLAEYLCIIEEAGFGGDDKLPLPGVAHYHQKCLKEMCLHWVGLRGAWNEMRKMVRPRAWMKVLWEGRSPAWKEILERGPTVFWWVLICISIFVSVWLALTKSEDTLSGHVTDASGHPMSALTVSLDSSHAVTTDTNGYLHNLRR